MVFLLLSCQDSRVRAGMLAGPVRRAPLLPLLCSRRASWSFPRRGLWVLFPCWRLSYKTWLLYVQPIVVFYSLISDLPKSRQHAKVIDCEFHPLVCTTVSQSQRASVSPSVTWDYSRMIFQGLSGSDFISFHCISCLDTLPALKSYRLRSGPPFRLACLKV